MPEGAPDMAMEARKYLKQQYSADLATRNSLQDQESEITRLLGKIEISSTDEYNALRDQLLGVGAKIKETSDHMKSTVESFQEEVSDEFKAKTLETLEESTRLDEQEKILFDQLSGVAHELSPEEFNVVLVQIKDVHERRKKFDKELEALWEQQEIAA